VYFSFHAKHNDILTQTKWVLISIVKNPQIILACRCDGDDRNENGKVELLMVKLNWAGGNPLV